MLTAKEEKFCQCVAVENMTYTDAYHTAYNTEKMADKTVNEKACLMAKKEKIGARIAEIRAELVSPKILTAKQRLEWLSEVIQSATETTTDKLKAADLMNKMQGEYVQKVEADVKGETTVNINLVDE